MIPWSGIPFLRFTIAFSLGIAVYFLYEIKIPTLIIGLVFLGLYLLLFLIQRCRKIFFYSLQPWLGFTALGFFFCIGLFLTESRDERNDPDHLLHHVINCDYYSGYVSGSEEEKENSKKVIFSVTQVYSENKWKQTNGDIILYYPKDQPAFKYGSRLLVAGSPSLVKPPANPGEFDYQKYLRFHHIFHQDFLKKDRYRILSGNEGNSLLSFANNIREKSDQIIKKLVPGKNESSIASALLLGIRSGMSDEIKTAYTSTGTMHVLAISGMHVAVVFQLLMLFFVFVPEHTFRNRLLIFLFLFSILWLFALVTGFSPSVLRAVFMFSVILLARLIRRNANIYNTLFFAGFCLLFYDPMLIADAGFQLSFLAVLGIVYFSDRMYYLKRMKYKILDMIWRITSVSLAAQIAVLPLSLFYFKQIPVYFLLANLIAIPFSTVILYGGIFLLTISWIPYLNVGTGIILSKLITYMNVIVGWIGNLPGATVQGITINSVELTLLYIGLLSLTAFFFYRKLLYLTATSLIVLIFVSLNMYSKMQPDKPEWIVFNVKNHLAFAFKDKNDAVLVLDSSLASDDKLINWSIKPYLIENGISDPTIVVPGKEKEYFIKQISEDLYLLVFNSKRIFINTSSESGSIKDYDYLVNFKKEFPAKSVLTVLSHNSELLYSSAKDGRFKVIFP